MTKSTYVPTERALSNLENDSTSKKFLSHKQNRKTRHRADHNMNPRETQVPHGPSVGEVADARSSTPRRSVPYVLHSHRRLRLARSRIGCNGSSADGGEVARGGGHPCCNETAEEQLDGWRRRRTVVRNLHDLCQRAGGGPR